MQPSFTISGDRPYISVYGRLQTTSSVAASNIASPCIMLFKRGVDAQLGVLEFICFFRELRFALAERRLRRRQLPELVVERAQQQQRAKDRQRAANSDQRSRGGSNLQVRRPRRSATLTTIG